MDELDPPHFRLHRRHPPRSQVDEEGREDLGSLDRLIVGLGRTGGFGHFDTLEFIDLAIIHKLEENEDGPITNKSSIRNSWRETSSGSSGTLRLRCSTPCLIISL